MTRLIFLGGALILLFSSCGTYVNKPYGTGTNQVSRNDFDLSVKILRIEEIRKEKNEIKVEYEVTNNSNELFTRSRKSYYVFFNIQTKEGREIGDYKKIYDKIQPHTSVVKTEKINLSVYNYKEVNASIFIE